MVLSPFVICLLFLIQGYLCATSCKIDLDEDFSHQLEPLILKGSVDEIIYPNSNNPKDKFTISVTGGDKIRIYCGKKNFKNFNPKEDFLVALCVNGGKFKLTSINSLKRYHPSEFACKSYVKSEIQISSNQTNCGLLKPDQKHTLYQIGFPISGKFLTLISTCFNTVTKSVLWSHHFVSPNVKSHVSKVQRIDFVQDKTPYGPNIDVEILYRKSHQRDVIAKILNSQRLAEKYIHDGKSLAFFARGHLAPKGDFVYGAEQLATFHYINVAPQWQYFNGGQWEKIESSLRQYVIEKNVKVSVLTLTLGITQLEDENRDDHDIYLYLTEEQKLVRVPKLYAKIVTVANQKQESKDDVVVIGVNQPYENHVKMTTNDIVCESVCEHYDWLQGFYEANSEKYSSGYIYCCKVNDFIEYLKTANDNRLGDVNQALMSEII